MATNVSNWRALLGPNAEGYDSNVIDKYVIDTLREFCDRTMVWRSALSPISVVASTAGYALSKTGADICGVYKAKYNDDLIDPVKEEWLNAYEPEWEDETSSIPERYYVGHDKKIYLVYTPSESLTDGLDVWCWLKPELTATTVEDFLYNEYRAAITDGAASRLMRISGAPKEDIKMADYFAGRYELGVARAKLSSSRGLSKAPLRGKNLGYI